MCEELYIAKEKFQRNLHYFTIALAYPNETSSGTF
jgi:hypothetical protein